VRYSTGACPAGLTNISIDAHSLLHCLRDAAAESPDVYPIAEIAYHQASTAIGKFHLTHHTTDQDVAMTISQRDQRSLIARLDNEKGLDLVTLGLSAKLFGDTSPPVIGDVYRRSQERFGGGGTRLRGNSVTSILESPTPAPVIPPTAD
jgi:hypothetical protein